MERKETKVQINKAKQREDTCSSVRLLTSLTPKQKERASVPDREILLTPSTMYAIICKNIVFSVIARSKDNDN